MERSGILMTTTTKTAEFGLTKTQKTGIVIAGIVILELAIVYGLAPLALSLWRVLTCPC